MPMEEDQGGRKKFLYSGSVSGKGHNHEEDQWSFGPKREASPRANIPIDLDNVWSIRNVGLGNSTASTVRSEPLAFKPEMLGKNTNSVFYSRHGGMKGRGPSPRSSDQKTNIGPAPAQWSSSGHNFSQGVRQQPPSFKSPTEKGFRTSRMNQNPSPFDRDLNDF